MGLLPEAAHIVVGHTVSHQASEVPQETLALVHGAHYLPLQDGKIQEGIVAVGILEDLRHVVGPVLATSLIAVLHNHFPGLAVLGRDTAKELAYERIIMRGDMLAAHLVHFQAGTFGNGGGIGDSGGFHIAGKHRPLPVRYFPAQLSVLQERREVMHEQFIHTVAPIDIFRRVPHIGIPHRKRFLEHLGQGFFGITGQVGLLRERDGERAVGRVFQPDLIGSGRSFDQTLHPRCQRLEAYVQAHVVAVIGKGGHFFSILGKPDRCPLLPVAFQDKRTHGERYLHLQGSRNPVACLERPAPGIPFHRQPGLDCDNAVRRNVRKRDDLLAAVSLHFLILPCDIFHALLRGNPRPAGLAPARAVEHADLDVQLPGPLHRRMGDVPPLVGKELHGAVGVAFGLVADESPRDAHALHRLQVFDDALLGDVVVQPIPVHGRPDGIRRCPEPFLQGLPAVVAGAAKRQRGTKEQQFLHHSST